MYAHKAPLLRIALLPVLVLLALAPFGQAQGAEHGHEHGHEHAGSRDAQDGGERFLTNRQSKIVLPLPDEQDAFFFAVFGDRTGGPADGVKILAQAVEEVNLFEPDLVMTVGDLIQGYNNTKGWLPQMREFKGIMNRLLMPWYPVAGNHDVYWRGGNRPFTEHDANYEAHFGPLWYAFRHKTAWFIVLYTDEGDPETGEKGFGKAQAQRMSSEQFNWLDETLKRTADVDHVFVFLHHPRWLGGRYGNDWERVHQRLAKAGNVSAVFAGHIHRMRYDGIRDGIEYFTLATVGGGQAGDLPDAGYLHHYNLVTVRKDRIAVSALPVGAAFDPRAVTGQVSDEARKATGNFRPSIESSLAFDSEFGVTGTFRASFENTFSRPLELSVAPKSADPRWIFRPDHNHLVLDPGESVSFTYQVLRESAPFDQFFAMPELSYQTDYLADGLRVALPSRKAAIPLDPSGLELPEQPARESVLAVNGKSACLRVEHAQLHLPDGPFTLEVWMNCKQFRERQGLVNKTEGSEFGFFVNGGKPFFDVNLDGKYASARSSETLQTGRWYHLAGVFDGSEARLYIDGQKVASVPASGARTIRDLPLLIGADVDGAGQPTSAFQGEIDEVRISKVVRYTGESFQPARRHAADEDTVLLLHMDGALGPWFFDSSPQRSHPRMLSGARLRASD